MMHVLVAGTLHAQHLAWLSYQYDSAFSRNAQLVIAQMADAQIRRMQSFSVACHLGA